MEMLSALNERNKKNFSLRNLFDRKENKVLNSEMSVEDYELAIKLFDRDFEAWENNEGYHRGKVSKASAYMYIVNVEGKLSPLVLLPPLSSDLKSESKYEVDRKGVKIRVGDYDKRPNIFHLKLWGLWKAMADEGNEDRKRIMNIIEDRDENLNEGVFRCEIDINRFKGVVKEMRIRRYDIEEPVEVTVKQYLITKGNKNINVKSFFDVIRNQFEVHNVVDSGMRSKENEKVIVGDRETYVPEIKDHIKLQAELLNTIASSRDTRLYKILASDYYIEGKISENSQRWNKLKEYENWIFEARQMKKDNMS